MSAPSYSITAVNDADHGPELAARRQDFPILERCVRGQPLVYNKENGATLMGITFTKADLNTQHRIELVHRIKDLCTPFAAKHKIDLHYSGMPYIRTEILDKIFIEMLLFLLLALLVTATILWAFYKSFTAVMSSMIVVLIGVVWSFGTIELMGYQITILTSLIPPIIIVIGIPNCIFLINKYHTEYIILKDKMKALEKTIEHIGILLFLANVTTAIGFGVLYFTHSTLLTEFGIVAAIDIMATYVLTLILIPIILSFLTPPSIDKSDTQKAFVKIRMLAQQHTRSFVFLKSSVILGTALIITYLIYFNRPVNISTLIYVLLIYLIAFFSIIVLTPATSKRTQHLDRKIINVILDAIDKLVHRHRTAIFTIITILTLISIYGMSKINVLGYVVDDLPKKDPVYVDLRFFESNFQGVLPFEIFIDTKKPNGVFSDNAKTLYKIRSLEKKLDPYPELSKPFSVVDAIKFSYQAYKGGDDKYFILPPPSELQKLSDYTPESKNTSDYAKSFLDTAKQFTRISLQVADIGSKKTKELLNKIKPVVDSIFDPKDYNVKITGHTPMFLKSNDYLLKNLIESLIIEIILITIVGIALFRSFRIIILSKLPCLIPLVITAGIMGFCSIRFKPSTILIFSIAFGISSDQTIYFLTKYRQELTKTGKTASQAISATIRETGFSMIYTAIILLAGFGIFAFSSFGGTKALGILISITLFVTMITNLVLLPAILLSLAKHPKTENP
jgi:predicted RND superfamily exporter protein